MGLVGGRLVLPGAMGVGPPGKTRQDGILLLGKGQAPRCYGRRPPWGPLTTGHLAGVRPVPGPGAGSWSLSPWSSSSSRLVRCTPSATSANSISCIFVKAERDDQRFYSIVYSLRRGRADVFTMLPASILSMTSRLGLRCNTIHYCYY